MVFSCLRVSLLSTAWCLVLLSSRQTLAEAQSCPTDFIKPSVDGAVVNGTFQREYVFGGHNWHPPVMEYLNDQVGKKFDPPITFRREHYRGWLNAPTVEEAKKAGLDFMITNPYRNSCYETEGGASTLATELKIRQDPDTGRVFNSSNLGAVLYTLSNRTDILTVDDVKGKIVGSNNPTGLATHLCYDVLLRNGVHNLQGPKQFIYFKHSNDALQGVLDGRLDVGCAAVFTLEFYKDKDTGERLDLSQFRILDEQKNMVDGQPFPFKMSTPLVPAFLVQAFPHVEASVTSRVQEALLNMRDHADVAPSLLACLEDRGCLANNTVCADECFSSLSPGIIKRCDTTAQIALKAYAAISDAIWGYDKPQANLYLRDVQESTGFLVKDPVARCVRQQDIVEAVTCPPGHFARSSEEILQSCNTSELECYDRPCYCRPCVEAFEVDFVVSLSTEAANEASISGTGCSKFSLCGTVEQEHELIFKAFDNKKRSNTTLIGSFLLGDDTEDQFVFNEVNGTFYYDFKASNMRVGQKVLTIQVCEAGGFCEEIPESPFRIGVAPRNCALDVLDELREPDEWGVCVCKSGKVEIAGSCMALAVVIPSLVSAFIVLVFVCVKIYVARMNRPNHNDSIWAVKRKELKFADPPEIIGRGTFGMVLLAEYRGTQVAVKRVIPAKGCSKDASTTGSDLFLLDDQGGTDSTGKMSADFNPGLESGHHGGLKSGDNVSSRYGAGRSSWGMIGRTSKDPFRSSSGGSVISVKKSLKDIEKGEKQVWEKLRTNFIEEMRVLSKLRHPCICTVMGAVIGNKEEPMLVMEYMDFGSLYDILKNDTMSVDGEIILPILRDISQGVRFLHSADPQVIHGDLKAANILVDQRFRAKVADFGLSQKKQLGGTGTPFWMAPELLRKETSNTTASDVFAFGVILTEVFSRKDPYEGEDAMKVLEQVADKAIQKRPAMPKNCPSQIQSMITDCLVDEADNRPSFEELDTRLKRVDVSAADVDTGSLRKSAVSLHDIFPKKIADALQAGRKPEPEHRDCVTIFFSDIVNFTNISSELQPQKVADLLDRLYHKFDELSNTFDIFKVETIGDAYMAVTNLVKDQHDDHAKRIAEFSIAAIAAANSTLIDVDDDSKGYVNLRCGFHSGPVVADVVGNKSPRYCLFGDTVNSAHRMESNSLTNRIHCSQASANLLKEQHPMLNIKSRGLISIKGKGEMHTWWVNEPRRPRNPANMTGLSGVELALKNADK